MAEKNIDDLYSLMERFIRVVEADVQVIREHSATSGSEVGVLKEEFRRTRSDLFRSVGATNERVDLLAARVENLSCMKKTGTDAD